MFFQYPESCRPLPSVSDLPCWSLGWTGSTPRGSFPLPLTLWLQPFLSVQRIEYTQDHPEYIQDSYCGRSSASCFGQGTLGTETTWVSVSVPLKSFTFSTQLRGFSRREEHALFYAASFLRIRLFSWSVSTGERKVCAVGQSFSWAEVVLLVLFPSSELFSLVANEKFIAFCWCN